MGLNPSYNGTWFRGRPNFLIPSYGKGVLTLLIMEHGFGGGLPIFIQIGEAVSLNPSYNGTWFRGRELPSHRPLGRCVLTLLIMEHGFGDRGMGNH